MTQRTEPYPLPPEVAATHIAADEMQQSIQSGTPDVPLVGDNSTIAEYSADVIRRVEDSVFKGKPPLHQLERKMDKEESQTRNDKINFLLHRIIGLGSGILGKAPYNESACEQLRYARHDANEIRELLGIEP